MVEFESGDLAICTTCGTQYDAPLSNPPENCRICDDPRQYVPPTGQTWTSLHASLPIQTNTPTTDPYDPRIHYLTTQPLYPPSSTLPPGLSDSTTLRKQLGIGQRAILLQTPRGNVLWDCLAFLDDATIEFVKGKGGIKAIVISHPHFYTTHLEWARVFGCPVYVHGEDEGWLCREEEGGKGVRKVIRGDVERIGEVEGEVVAVRCGGHFEGSMVLSWGRRLFVADTIMVVPSGHYHKNRLPDTTTFSFMWSYPNMIPLPPASLREIWEALKSLEFDTVYGGFMGQNVSRPDLKAKVLESMKIFLKIGGHEQAAKELDEVG